MVEGKRTALRLASRFVLRRTFPQQIIIDQRLEG